MLISESISNDKLTLKLCASCQNAYVLITFLSYPSRLLFYCFTRKKFHVIRDAVHVHHAIKNSNAKFCILDVYIVAIEQTFFSLNRTRKMVM